MRTIGLEPGLPHNKNTGVKAITYKPADSTQPSCRRLTRGEEKR